MINRSKEQRLAGDSRCGLEDLRKIKSSDQEEFQDIERKWENFKCKIPETTKGKNPTKQIRERKRMNVVWWTLEETEPIKWKTIVILNGKK